MLNKQTVKMLYIAAPSEEFPFIQELIQEISSKHLVFTGLELQNFVNTEYEDCPEIKANLHDTFSLVEQEICFRKGSHLQFHSIYIFNR